MRSHFFTVALVLLKCIRSIMSQEPYEFFCTSESAFQSDSPASYKCEGTETVACEDADGQFDDVENKCDGIDTTTSAACDAIAGFTYSVDLTCDALSSLMSIPAYESNFLNCAIPGITLYMDQIQSNCCGGTEYHKDLCPDVAKPYEAFCTSESAFQSDSPAFYKCEGTDADACEDAGGKFNDEENKCDDIGTESPDECNAITGFVHTVDSTCSEVGYMMSIPEYASIYQDCSNPVTSYITMSYQPRCCGGSDNYKDMCPDAAKPYEAFCTSESAFQSDSPAFYKCEGTDADACEDAGGKFNDEENKCDDIDAENPDECNAITGFVYTVDSTCSEFGYIMSIPGYASVYQNCSNLDFQKFSRYYRSRCCGGSDNYKDICPEISSTPADICRECEGHSDISDECFDLVTIYDALEGLPDDVLATCGDPESASDVEENCVASALAYFNCTETSSSPFMTVGSSLLLTAVFMIIVIVVL